MKYISNAVMFSAIVFGVGCTKHGNTPSIPRETATVTYTESLEDFPNPERGFFEYSETYGSGFQTLSENTLKSYRNPKTGSGASYKTVSTLVFRYYVMDSFKDSPLPESFLTKISQDFVTARNAGVKLIPRFNYTLTASPGSCPEGFICPPYGDAPKAIVLGHIAQLKPILQANADVTAAVQMGFIGVWGENYYTDYFGDASSSGQGKLLDQNWADRFDVLRAVLDAVPSDVMVQVRYPQMKQRFIYGVNALTSSAALTEAEAFTEADKARIGYHNDCFLASSDDYGTYTDYGNSSSARGSATAVLRQYYADDSKFVVVGGETCGDDYSPQNDCEPLGKAQAEFKMMHYSFLNADYNSAVDNDWATGGCIDNIKRQLGYRIALTSGTYSKEVKNGEKLNVEIDLINNGYAAPFKARPVFLVLRDKATGATHSFAFETEIRKWYTDTPVKLQGAFVLDSSVTAGEYELFLNLPDKYESIAGRFEYSIQLANAGVWEGATGYNNLGQTVVVD